MFLIGETSKTTDCTIGQVNWNGQSYFVIGGSVRKKICAIFEGERARERLSGPEERPARFYGSALRQIIICEFSPSTRTRERTVARRGREK